MEFVRRMGVVDNTIVVIGDGVAAAGHRRFCVHGSSGMRHNRESERTKTKASADVQKYAAGSAQPYFLRTCTAPPTFDSAPAQIRHLTSLSHSLTC